MQGRVVCLALLSASIATRMAHASGEAPPAVIVQKSVEGKRTQPELMSETIDVGLQSHTVKDLQVRSVVEDAGGRLLEAAEVGRSVIPSNPGLSLRPDVVVARYGQVVSMPRPHKRTLAPGVYAETLRLSISDSSYSVPVIVSRTRFFRVSEDGGVEQIDSAAYSRVVDGPGKRARERDGQVVLVHDGKAFPRDSAKWKQVTVPRRGADGSIVNLDAAVRLPAVPVETGDERNED